VQTVDVGMDRDHLLIVDVDANARGYSGHRLGTFAHELRDRIAALPGVAAVTFSENGIFSGTESGTTIQVPGFVARTPDDTSIAYDQVGPGYAHALGGRMVQGRDLDSGDESSQARVLVLNQSAANLYFPGQSAIGKFVRFQDSIAIQIVGVMADTRDHQLTGSVSPRLYLPFVRPDTALGLPGGLRLEVRTAGDPTQLVQPIRKAIVALDPALPIDGVDPLSRLMQQSIREERLVARLASAFGVLALLLASIGLYGVMTYAITRRTGEIGLRVALGARQDQVVRMVLFDALRLVAVGLIVGLPLALGSTRLLPTQLHGVEAIDPVSLGVAIAVLTASAVIAVLLPALRASKVSPIVALRAE
jgi:predicted permease